MITLAPRAFAVLWEELDRWILPTQAAYSGKLPKDWSVASIGELVTPVAQRVKVEKGKEYKLCGVKWYGEGVFLRESVSGESTSATFLTPVVPRAFIYNRLFAWKTSFAVVPTELDGCFVSGEFPQFVVNEQRLLPEYLYLFFRLDSTIRAVNAASVGTAAVSRNRFKEVEFLSFRMPLPPLAAQRVIVKRWQQAQQEIAAARQRVETAGTVIAGKLYAALGTPQHEAVKLPKLMVLQWDELERWSFTYLARARAGLSGLSSAKYPVVPLRECVIETMNGFCIKPVAGPTSHMMLKLNALSDFGLDVRQTKFVKVPDKIANQFSIHASDLFICRSIGSYDLIAKCAVAAEDRPDILFPDLMIRVRFKNNILPDYVREVIQTPLGRSHFQSNARTAVGMWKIGAQDILNFQIPLPPLAVQRAIVQRIGAARAAIAREQETAACLARETEAEVEAMILGTKPVS